MRLLCFVHMKSRESLSEKVLHFVYAQAQPVYLTGDDRDLTCMGLALHMKLQEEIGKFSFEIFQFILMQSKKASRIVFFSHFQLER